MGGCGTLINREQDLIDRNKRRWQAKKAAEQAELQALAKNNAPRPAIERSTVRPVFDPRTSPTFGVPFSV